MSINQFKLTQSNNIFFPINNSQEVKRPYRSNNTEKTKAEIKKTRILLMKKAQN